MRKLNCHMVLFTNSLKFVHFNYWQSCVFPGFVALVLMSKAYRAMTHDYMLITIIKHATLLTVLFLLRAVDACCTGIIVNSEWQ
jgi:hypothetical protein